MSFIIRDGIIFLLICTSFAGALSVSGYRSVHDELFIEKVDIERLSSDSCNPSPCQNDGQCFVRSKAYKCFCKQPFFGKNCELDPCTESPCENGGTCVLSGYSFKCECIYPYRGYVCQEDLCANDPCYNGGTCEMDGDQYKCKCRFPYSGVNCENEWKGTSPDDEGTSINDVTDDYQLTTHEPTKFPEIYNETTDSYQWTSNDTSEFPEVFNTTSDTYQWTSNDSSEFPDIFNDTSDSYQWTTNETSEFPEIFNETTDSYQWTTNETSEFTDDFNSTYNPSNFTDDFNVSLYEIKIFTESYNLTTIKPGICVEDRDCYNGGICRRRDRQYYCDCLKNFGGNWCEINMLCEKLNSTCRLMGANCEVIGFKAICHCPYDKMYNPKSGVCENICDPWRCVRGTCEIMERTYKCNCESGYTGHICNERIKVNPDRRNLWLPIMTFLLTLICLLLIGVICHICRYRK